MSNENASKIFVKNCKDFCMKNLKKFLAGIVFIRKFATSDEYNFYNETTHKCKYYHSKIWGCVPFFGSLCSSLFTAHPRVFAFPIINIY